MINDDILTKFCTACNTRHPASYFSPGQRMCKEARNRNAREDHRHVEMPDDYMKFCKKCDSYVLAKDNFKKDVSRPDGYFLYCKGCDVAMRSGGKTMLTKLLGLTLEFRERLILAVFRSIKDKNRSIVRQMVEDFKHEGEPISFAGREWQIDILNDMRPNVVARKPSQIGLTWVLERWIIEVLLKYSKNSIVD